MLAKHKTTTNLGVGCGVALQIASTYVAPPSSAVLMIVGWIAFIWGCSEYARGKGHSPWFGALGLLSLLGLIVLAVMPDRHKELSASA